MKGDARPGLVLAGVSAGYRQPRRPAREVVGGVDTELRPGELVCLLGPNGAGKSTLLKTLSGMLPPLAGRIVLGGRPLGDFPARELARELAVVLTERVTAGALSAFDLVALGRYPYTGWSGRLGEDDHAVVWRALAAVGATDLAQRTVAELSDGERQRVMIGRALAQEPTVLVLDEVTAFLDLPRRVQVLRLLRDLAHEGGRAVLLSTHDLELALRTADRLWLLPRGGPFTAGLPEELVLSGAFDTVFASEGLRFDREAGSFLLHATAGAVVEVAGSGLVAVWTAKAMERLGYRPVAVAQEAPRAGVARIEVPTAAGAPFRLFSPAGSSTEPATLADLAAALSQPLGPVR